MTAANMIESYWATADDPVFEIGHYVESWELGHVAQLSRGVTDLLRAEALRGNKVRSISKGIIELALPLTEEIGNLPTGLVFWCPLQEQSIGHYDGDEYGVIVCLETGTRIYPSEREAEDDSDLRPFASGAV